MAPKKSFICSYYTQIRDETKWQCSHCLCKIEVSIIFNISLNFFSEIIIKLIFWELKHRVSDTTAPSIGFGYLEIQKCSFSDMFCK